MIKVRSVQNFWLRAGLSLLIWEAAVLALAWLFFWWFHWLQRFSDVLLMFGALEAAAAGFGMLNRPESVASRGGVWALPVQDTEEEKHFQAVAGYIEKKSFAVRLLASGLLTIALSTALAYGFQL